MKYLRQLTYKIKGLFIVLEVQRHSSVLSSIEGYGWWHIMTHVGNSTHISNQEAERERERERMIGVPKSI
jgi:hypothetical protein